MVRWLGILLIGLVLAPPAPGAVRVDGLYDAEVPVSGQGAAERAQALREALGEVITRISGSQQLDRYPPVTQALQRAADYVQQYRYRESPAATGAVPAAVPAVSLWVRFEQAAVDRLLRASGLPSWGAERPVTLVWLAVEDRRRRRIVGADTEDPVRMELERQARRRGIPLLFPLLDLEDRGKVGFADVWGGFADALEQASARYRPEAILAGRMYRRPDGDWDVRWVLYGQGPETDWSAAGSDLARVLATGVDGVADALVSHYALRSDHQAGTPVRLVVAGAASLGDYARINKYLASLAAVIGARAVEVDADHVTYEVDVRGGGATLGQSFALGNTLVPDRPAGSGGKASASSSSDLHYRLLP